jgi:WhiB family redox-sensing transcriptional regulator
MSVGASSRVDLIRPLDLAFELALCADELYPDAWHPETREDGQSARAAVRVCLRCPIQNECLREALDNRIPYGIYGGLSATERQRLIRKKKVV